MNTTPSPAIEAVELPPLPRVWHSYTADHMRDYAKTYGRSLLAAKQEEVDRMREALKDAISELEQSGMAYDHPKLKSLRAALSPIQGADHG